MSTYRICLQGEIRKMSTILVEESILSNGQLTITRKKYINKNVFFFSDKADVP